MKRPEHHWMVSPEKEAEMAEPTYTFTLPSIEDLTPLDCRIYHPWNFHMQLQDRETIRGAIVAHPYAPLGGCFDDSVVLSITETLLNEGFVVGTFNFRGAPGSSGKTSWTGKPEQVSLNATGEHHGLETILSVDDRANSNIAAQGHAQSPRISQADILLGGYSYGSLILARLPKLSEILHRFEIAEIGTSAAKVVVRAHTLAAEAKRTFRDTTSPTSPRGRTDISNAATANPGRRSEESPVTFGDSENRTRRRSGSRDLIRKGIEKAHIKRRSLHSDAHTGEERAEGESQTTPNVSVRYLAVSPVVLPFSSTLCPPGTPTSVFKLGKQMDAGPGELLANPTLAVFGSEDGFTSSHRLTAWAKKQSADTSSAFEWTEIEGAGHFWRELGAMKALQQRIVSWVESSTRSKPLL